MSFLLIFVTILILLKKQGKSSSPFLAEAQTTWTRRAAATGRTAAATRMEEAPGAMRARAQRTTGFEVTADMVVCVSESVAPATSLSWPFEGKVAKSHGEPAGEAMTIYTKFSKLLFFYLFLTVCPCAAFENKCIFLPKTKKPSISFSVGRRPFSYISNCFLQDIFVRLYLLCSSKLRTNSHRSIVRGGVEFPIGLSLSG